MAKPPTIKPLTNAELIRELDHAQERLVDLREALSEARKSAEEQRRELNAVREERTTLRTTNNMLIERSMSDRAENARLGGKLEMLRELGTIPSVERSPDEYRIDRLG